MFRTMKNVLTNIMSRFVTLALLIAIAVPAMAALDADHLSAFTERGMDLWHVPGMSVAVVTQDDVLMQRGFGKTAAKKGQAVDEHTLFSIASTTKAMVAAGILMLVDEGDSPNQSEILQVVSSGSGLGI